MRDEDEADRAEALAIHRLHGDDGPRWIAERITALARHADENGVTRLTRIALAYAGLLGAAHRGGREGE